VSERISNDDLRKVIGGAYAFVEPQDAGITFRSVCEELLAARTTPPACVCVCEGIVKYDGMAVILDDGKLGIATIHAAVIGPLKTLDGHRVRVWVEDMGGAK
jgi:hypothetical protein